MCRKKMGTQTLQREDGETWVESEVAGGVVLLRSAKWGAGVGMQQAIAGRCPMKVSRELQNPKGPYASLRFLRRLPSLAIFLFRFCLVRFGFQLRICGAGAGRVVAFGTLSVYDLFACMCSLRSPFSHRAYRNNAEAGLQGV